MIQGGDFTNFDGSGGYCAPTTNDGLKTFPDESFDASHNSEGVLSMANKGKNTNGSQFFITLGKTLHLDGKHVAFGKVVRGMEVIREVARVETEGENGRPVKMQRVVIVDCGIGTGEVDSDQSSSSSSEASSVNGAKNRSSSKSKRKKHRHEDSTKKKHKRRKLKDDEHKKRRHKDKSSHKHRRRRSDSDDSSPDEERRRRDSSRKRHKSDRRSDGSKDDSDLRRRKRK